jgi:hypothetical protein
VDYRSVQQKIKKNEGLLLTPRRLSRFRFCPSYDFESSAFNRARPPLRFSNVAFLLPQTDEEIGE